MSNQDALNDARTKKSAQPIEQQIANIEASVTAKVASEATENVYIDGWGTFYRRDDGWHGPGGFYGSMTPMAKKCEEESLKAKQ